MRRVDLRTALAIFAALSSLLDPNAARGMPLAGGELHVSRSVDAIDCPDEQTLGASTAALGATSDETSSAAPTAALRSVISVAVELDRDQIGYVARIHARGRKSGEREIRSGGDSCGPLAEATTLALAVLFDLLPEDPAALASPNESPAASPSTPPSPTAPPVVHLPLPRPRPVRSAAGGRTREPMTLSTASLGAHGGFASGLLGHALTGHVGATLRVRAGRRLDWRTGGFWAPGRDLPHGPGVVSVFLVAGSEEITLALARSERGELGARLGISLGAIVGAGRGYAREGTAVEFWLAPGLGVAGRWRMSPSWSLALSTTLLVPSRQQTFSIAEVPGKAFRSAPAAVLVEMGPELDLF